MNICLLIGGVKELVKVLSQFSILNGLQLLLIHVHLGLVVELLDRDHAMQVRFGHLIV